MFLTFQYQLGQCQMIHHPMFLAHFSKKEKATEFCLKKTNYKYTLPQHQIFVRNNIELNHNILKNIIWECSLNETNICFGFIETEDEPYCLIQEEELDDGEPFVLGMTFIPLETNKEFINQLQSLLNKFELKDKIYNIQYPISLDYALQLVSNNQMSLFHGSSIYFEKCSTNQIQKVFQYLTQKEYLNYMNEYKKNIDLLPLCQDLKDIIFHIEDDYQKALVPNNGFMEEVIDYICNNIHIGNTLFSQNIDYQHPLFLSLYRKTD